MGFGLRKNAKSDCKLNHDFLSDRPSVRTELSSHWADFHWSWHLIFFLNVLLTVHLSISLNNDQLDAHLLYFILQYVYYNPLHVSSIICSSSGGWILLMQHLVSSHSVRGRPVHRFETELQTSSVSTCAPDGHLLRVTIPDAASITFNLLMMII